MRISYYTLTYKTNEKPSDGNNLTLGDIISSNVSFVESDDILLKDGIKLKDVYKYAAENGPINTFVTLDNRLHIKILPNHKYEYVSMDEKLAFYKDCPEGVDCDIPSFILEDQLPSDFLRNFLKKQLY